MTQPRLLATDLDGTFIGDDASMHELWRELEESGIVVAFSTGRHLPSIQAFYADSGTTRKAGACICMVGAEGATVGTLAGLAKQAVSSW